MGVEGKSGCEAWHHLGAGPAVQLMRQQELNKTTALTAVRAQPLVLHPLLTLGQLGSVGPHRHHSVARAQPQGALEEAAAGAQCCTISAVPRSKVAAIFWHAG